MAALIIKQDKENLPRHHLAYSFVRNNSNHNNLVCTIKLSPPLSTSRAEISHPNKPTILSKGSTNQFKFKLMGCNKNRRMHSECYNKRRQESRNYIVLIHFKGWDSQCTMCTKMNNHQLFIMTKNTTTLKYNLISRRFIRTFRCRCRDP